MMMPLLARADALAGGGSGAVRGSGGWPAPLGAVHLDGAPALVHSLTDPYMTAALPMFLAVGVLLWTAIELPVTAGRLPGLRRAAALLLGLALFAAPLLTVALAFSLLGPASSVTRWLTILALIVCSGTSVVAAALGCDLLARIGLSRRTVLVLDNPPEWTHIGAHPAPGHDPSFRVAEIRPAYGCPALAADGLRKAKIWGVVTADDAAFTSAELQRDCRRAGVRLLREDEFRERWLRRVDIDRLRPGTIAAARSERRAGGGFGRRAADIALSIVLLVVTLPISILAAILIKLESSGSVLYRQERVGLHGKPFLLTKFRSMRSDAEAAAGPQWANLADPRATRIGTLMRRTRIDELPQLWNVLRGEMSIIGPRPERPYFVEQLSARLPCYNDRSLVKPGITGWAQVNYRYGASIEDARVKLAYDLYYVRHRSALLDLRILAATVRVVLRQEGAR